MWHLRVFDKKKKYVSAIWTCWYYILKVHLYIRCFLFQSSNSSFKRLSVILSIKGLYFGFTEKCDTFLGCFVLRSYSTSPFLGKTWNILIILNRTRHNKNAIAILWPRELIFIKMSLELIQIVIREKYYILNMYQIIMV